MNTKYIIVKATGQNTETFIMEKVDLTYPEMYDYLSRIMPEESRYLVANQKKMVTREYFWHFVNDYIGFVLCWIKPVKPYLFV